MAKQKTGAARAVGSPTKRPKKLRTPENAERICERLARGRTLRQIARELRIESASSITDWVRGDSEFAAQYARARDAGYERMADEIIEISDADCTFEGRPDNALVQQARLRSDNRKWFLSKVLPKRFGDKVTQEITGDPNAPLLTRIELVAVQPRSQRPSDDGLEYGPGDEPPLKLAETLPKPRG
jgi:hypothetical protein